MIITITNSYLCIPQGGTHSPRAERPPAQWPRIVANCVVSLLKCFWAMEIHCHSLENLTLTYFCYYYYCYYHYYYYYYYYCYYCCYYYYYYDYYYYCY